MVIHFFPNVAVDSITLGEFYRLVSSIGKIEKWKRGESDDPNRPMTPEEFLEAAKRGEITPDSIKARVADPMTIQQQSEFLRKAGIKRP